VSPLTALHAGLAARRVVDRDSLLAEFQPCSYNDEALKYLKRLKVSKNRLRKLFKICA
jgi:hypothetical protein